MATTVEKVVTEFFVRVRDIFAPDRELGWHVNFVEKTTYDDGSVKFGEEQQCNMTRAVAEGLALPVILEALNVENRAKAEADAATIERLTKDRDYWYSRTASADAVNTAQALEINKLKLLLAETADALRAEIAAKAEAETTEERSLLSKLTFGLLGN